MDVTYALETMVDTAHLRFSRCDAITSSRQLMAAESSLHIPLMPSGRLDHKTRLPPSPNQNHYMNLKAARCRNRLFHRRRDISEVPKHQREGAAISRRPRIPSPKATSSWDALRRKPLGCLRRCIRRCTVGWPTGKTALKLSSRKRDAKDNRQSLLYNPKCSFQPKAPLIPKKPRGFLLWSQRWTRKDTKSNDNVGR